MYKHFVVPQNNQDFWMIGIVVLAGVMYYLFPAMGALYALCNLDLIENISIKIQFSLSHSL